MEIGDVIVEKKISIRGISSNKLFLNLIAIKLSIHFLFIEVSRLLEILHITVAIYGKQI